MSKDIQIFSTEYWMLEYEYWNLNLRIHSDIQIVAVHYLNIYTNEAPQIFIGKGFGLIIVLKHSAMYALQ